uniref:Uncharacterized protein n=1 Tax=Pyxicephalus adspersus TaxID=30357 RepID=A0AAV2ZZM1_PYXAD|nr:TPA: hypothetical protein GDO54_002403 [Pyxicephalus adspersus]
MIPSSEEVITTMHPYCVCEHAHKDQKNERNRLIYSNTPSCVSLLRKEILPINFCSDSFTGNKNCTLRHSPSGFCVLAAVVFHKCRLLGDKSQRQPSSCRELCLRLAQII